MRWRTVHRQLPEGGLGGRASGRVERGAEVVEGAGARGHGVPPGRDASGRTSECDARHDPRTRAKVAPGIVGCVQCGRALSRCVRLPGLARPWPPGCWAWGSRWSGSLVFVATSRGRGGARPSASAVVVGRGRGRRGRRRGRRLVGDQRGRSSSTSTTPATGCASCAAWASPAARWPDVRDAGPQFVAGSACVVLRLRDGRTTTIPVEVAGRRPGGVRPRRPRPADAPGLIGRPVPLPSNLSALSGRRRLARFMAPAC